MCGGGFTKGTTCLKWAPDAGTWTQSHDSLSEQRAGHVTWIPVSGKGTYLIGGFESASKRTSTIIKNDGSIETGFSLKYDTR